LIKKDTFDKEKFKKELESNVRMLFRRKLEEATPQQIYQAVAYSVKDDIIDNWIETQSIRKTGQEDGLLHVHGVPYG